MLESVARHLDRRPRVVVVDSGSTDDGGARAREWGAELVDLGANPGFGAANNAGLERVREPVTVLVNPDVVLLDDGLARLAELAAAQESLEVPRLLHPASARIAGTRAARAAPTRGHGQPRPARAGYRRRERGGHLRPARGRP